jgi:hypothetical protein
MNQDKKIQWKRISVEAVVIVASILLAFAIEAWWDTRIQEGQRQGHVSALIRDFDQMHERAMASHANAERAANSGIEILTGISTRKEWDSESALNQLTDIFYYEVFSPSIGGYESLINSGSVELLRSTTLKRELASFFGSFEDTRVSEQMLVGNLAQIFRSAEFGHLVGMHRLPVAEFPKFDAAPVEDWNDSEYLTNMVALITLSQKDLMEDYQYLLDLIESIRGALTEEERIN